MINELGAFPYGTFFSNNVVKSKTDLFDFYPNLHLLDVETEYQ